MNITVPHQLIDEGLVTREHFTTEPSDHVYSCNATLHGTRLSKVRVTIRRNSYAFQCSARAEVFDPGSMKWNIVATRSPSEVGDAISYHDYATKVIEQSRAVCRDLLLEVYALLE